MYVIILTNQEKVSYFFKIIDKYKNNVRMEGILKEELVSLETNIKKANDKIGNNHYATATIAMFVRSQLVSLLSFRISIES